MKSANTMTILMAVLFISAGAVKGFPDVKINSGSNQFQVTYSPGLELLANQLVSAYLMENPDVRIRVLPFEGPGFQGELGHGTIALVNKDAWNEKWGSVFKLEFARDALVPIMHSAHPQRDLIMEQGISPEEFAALCSADGSLTWGEVLGVPDSRPIHLVVPEGTCARKYLGEFMHMDPGWTDDLEVLETKQLIDLVENDWQALGFCSLAKLIDLEKAGSGSSIALVPVDADGDNRIGAFEDIYASGSSLSHAIYVGRFPHSLYSRIYAVTATSPSGTGEAAFMEWLLGGGQDIVAGTGMLALGFGERHSRMEKLTGHEQVFASVPVQASPARIFLLIGGVFLFMGLLVYAVARIRTSSDPTPVEIASSADGNLEAPGGLLFDKSHTWVFMEKSGMVRIGIDGFLRQLAGPVSRVATKQPGEPIKKGEICLTLIQNGKRLEIKSPLSGIVREQNEDLLSDASWLNSDPYNRGWVLTVEPQNWLSELRAYFMGSSYHAWLKQEGARLKAFFTNVLRLEDTACPEPVMQDGGEIRPGILESFGPEVWEEFQEVFLDSSR